MKKRFMTLAMAALLLGSAGNYLPAEHTAAYAAEKIYAFEQYTYKITDGGIEISGCDKSAVEVEIPQSIDGIPVTAIGMLAFSGCSALKYVRIPEGVVSINAFAFSGCNSLVSIVLPESLRQIGSDAFSGCQKLSVLSIPQNVSFIGSDAFSGTEWLRAKREANPLVIENGILLDGKTASGTVAVPSGVTVIGDEAFVGNDAVTALFLPESVTGIGQGAFRSCISLAGISFPKSILSIGSEAFTDTKWLRDQMAVNPVVLVNGIIIAVDPLAENIVIPEGVTDLGFWLYGHSAVKSVTVPQSMTHINERAFQNCTALRIAIIPDGTESIGDFAFADCTSLVSAELPETVTRIGNSAFMDCKTLTAFTVPESVTCIGENAFQNCDSLMSLTIPPSVTEIGGDAFLNCDHLTIYGITGSYAETYARENAIPFMKLKKPGDLNGDGYVNLKDVVLLRRFVAGGWGVEL